MFFPLPYPKNPISIPGMGFIFMPFEKQNLI